MLVLSALCIYQLSSFFSPLSRGISFVFDYLCRHFFFFFFFFTFLVVFISWSLTISCLLLTKALLHFTARSRLLFMWTLHLWGRLVRESVPVSQVLRHEWRPEQGTLRDRRWSHLQWKRWTEITFFTLFQPFKLTFVCKQHCIIKKCQKKGFSHILLKNVTLEQGWMCQWSLQFSSGNK